MKELILSCGEKTLLDDEDYERIPKTGWYLVRKEIHNSNTDYVQHDKYGKLHRFILGIKDKNILVDHLDRNGLNNQKTNLKLVTCSENKRNQNTTKSNKFNFNGISFEPKTNAKSSARFKATWSTFEDDNRYGTKRKKQCKKSFALSKYESPDLALKDAILYRLEKMKEFNYNIDERSTTIKTILENTDNPNMSEILGIDLYSIIGVEYIQANGNGAEKDIV